MEVDWPQPDKADGLVVGRVSLAGAPARTTVEVQRLLDVESVLRVSSDSTRLWGAVIAAEAAPAQPGVVFQTSATGAFRVKRLPLGLYSVRAPRHGGRSTSVIVLLARSGAGARVELDVVKGPHALRLKTRPPEGPSRPASVFLAPRETRVAPTGLLTLLRAQSGSDGRVTLEGLPAGDYRAYVHDPTDRSLREMGLRLPTSGELAWPLGPVVTLRGRVVDAEGKPVASARVRIDQPSLAPSLQTRGREQCETSCDAEGHFTWECPFHPEELTASAPGKGRGTLAIDDPTRRERDLEHTAPWDTAVDGEEEPVRHSVNEEDPEPDEASPDEASAGGPPIAPTPERPRDPTPDEFLEIRLAAGGRISGRVRDGDASVAGARVVAFQLGGALLFALRGPAECLTALTGSDGTFEILDVPPGSYVVAAGGEGWTAAGLAGAEPSTLLPALGPRGAEVRAGETLHVDLTVRPVGRIEGRVLDPEGRRVMDAHVTAVVEPTEDTGGRMYRLGGLESAFSGVVSGVGGKFHDLEAPPDVEIRLAATGPDGTFGLSEPFRVAGAGRRDADVTVAPGVFVGLRVTRVGSSRPIAGVMVELSRRSLGALHPRLAQHVWRTDKLGRAQVGPLPSDGATLALRDPASPWERETTVQVPPADTQPWPELIEVKLPAPARLNGKVIGPAGAPLDTTTFLVEAPDPDGPYTVLRGRRSISSGNVGKSGAFELGLSGTESSRLHAFLRWNGDLYSANVITPVPAQDLTLRLAPLRPTGDDPAIVVRVVDPQGKPVPRARFQLWTLEGRIPARARISGHERSTEVLRGVGWTRLPDRLASRKGEAGTCWIDVWGARDGPTSLPLGCVRIGPLPARGGIHELVLPPERRLTVWVKGPDGRGVEGVKVRAYLPDLGSDAAPAPGERRLPQVEELIRVSSGQTAADGSASLGGLGVGPCVLDVQPPPGFVAPAMRPLAAGETRADVQLVRAVEAELSVVDEAGRPLERARVAVFPHLPRASPSKSTDDAATPRSGDDAVERLYRAGVRTLFGGETDAQGRVRITGVDPAIAVDLVVHPGAPRMDLEPQELESWKPAPTRVTLTGASGLRVRVKRKDGAPTGAFALWRLGSSGWRRERYPTAQADGTLFLRTFGGGESVLLLATPPGWRAPIAPSAQKAWAARASRVPTKAGGATDLFLAEGQTLVLRFEQHDSGVSVSGVITADPLEGQPPTRPYRRMLSPLPGLGQEEPDDPWVEVMAQRGTIRVPDLDPEEAYVVHLVSDDDRAAVARGVRVSPQGTTLALTPSVPLIGRIVPAPEAGQTGLISFADPGLDGEVDVHADGSFGILGLPAGEWRLRAEIVERGRTVFERVFVARGDVQPEVQLKRGSLDEALQQLLGHPRPTPDRRDELVELVLDIDPSEPEAGLVRAEARLAAKDVAGALADVEHVLAVWPHHADALGLRSRIRWDQRDFAGALDDAEHAVERDDRAHWKYVLAWRYARTLRPTDASRLATAALAQEPTMSRAAALLVDLARERGASQEALGLAEATLKRFPEAASVQAAWARVVRRVGRPGDVLPRIDAWIEAARSSDPDVRRELALERAWARIETDAARAATAELLSLAPEAGTWIEVPLWVAQARAGSLEAAQARAAALLDDKRAAPHAPDMVPLLEFLAGRRTAESLVQDAQERGQRPAQLGEARVAPTVVWFYVAERRRATGDLSGAIEAYRTCVATPAERDAEFTLAINALATLAGQRPSDGPAK